MGEGFIVDISEKAIDWLNAAREIGGGKVAFVVLIWKELPLLETMVLLNYHQNNIEIALPALKKLAESIHNQGLKVIAHNCGQLITLLICGPMRWERYLLWI